MKKIDTKRLSLKTLIVTVLLFVILFGSISHVTADVGKKLALIETDERMFWEIHGTSADGIPSAVYILGTIHIGDERLYPLSEPIRNALQNANRIVGEVAEADMINIQAAVMEMMLTAASASLRIEDPLTNYLSQEEINFLGSVIIDPDILQTTYLFDPWFLMIYLSAVEMEKTELTAEYGLDVFIYTVAAERGIEVEGLDTLETQLDILFYKDFNFEEQLEILHEALGDLMEVKSTDETLDDVYEVYLDNDKVAVAESFAADEKGASAVLQKYMKLLLDDRDAAWAKLIPTYIDEGGTTFIFAGAGHFVGDNSVFAHMQRNGVLDDKKARKKWGNIDSATKGGKG